MPPIAPVTVYFSLLTAIMAGVLAIYAYRRSDVRGARSFAALMCVVGLRALGDSLSATRHDLTSALLLFNVGQTGLMLMPALWLTLALDYTGRTAWLRPRRLALIFAGSALATLIMWTDFSHHLLRGVVTLVDYGSITYLDFRGGPLFGVVIGYVYLALLITVPLYIDALVRRPFKAQPLALLLSMLVPLAYYSLYFLRVIPFRPTGPGVLNIPVSGLFMAWALFRHGLLDVTPVARDWVLESMPDAVLVLDNRERVVDLNPAARTLLNLRKGTALGRPAAEVLTKWPSLLELSRETWNGPAEIDLPGPDGMRNLDLHVADLTDREGRPTGRVIVLRDLSVRKSVEQDLAQANELLRVQLERVHYLQAQLREEAIRDSLTGLFNRRYLQEALEIELARSQRGNWPVSVIMIDIDHFKMLNDTYGHEAGDRMLEGLGALVLAHVRAGDVACRYGGEEFVLVLPTASLEISARRADELRAAAAAFRLGHGQDMLKTTLSLGVAAFPDHGATAAGLLRAADQALYTAKAAGRNRVVVQPVRARARAVDHAESEGL